jgi:prolyl 4-hydroxylase
VLYESHSVIHGRPFRFQGRYYANVFLHFEPYGYTERHAQRAAPFSVKADASARKLWDEAQQRQRHRAEEQTSSSKRRYSIPKLPHYIQEGTPEATRWQQMYAFQRDDVVRGVVRLKIQIKKDWTLFETVFSLSHNISHLQTQAILDNPKKKQESTKAKEVTMHAAAANGDLERIKELAAKDRSLLFYVDENGWQPLHEAARAGQTLVVEYLLAEGADLNARTNRGFGATPLWWAEQSLTPDHPTVKILRQLNAIKQGPMEEVEETAKDAE